MRSLEAVLVPIVLVLSMAIVSTAPVTASVAGVPPASAPWAPIPNTEDLFFRQVANFSLLIWALVFREYLDLVQVVSGSVQVAGAGNNYSLLLRAADRTSGAVGRYKTVVWGVPGSRDWTWKVLSFQRVADKN